MRNTAPSWLLVTLLAILIASPLSADSLFLVGKEPVWEVWGAAPRHVNPSSTEGEALETPNQKRRRLGLPIEASFPSPESGVAEETPNQRRHRLNVVSAEMIRSARNP